MAVAKNSTQSKMFTDLRGKAELLLQDRTADRQAPTLEDFDCLLHELEVHQIELEMQNEELRNAQQIIEAVSIEYTDLYDFAPIAYLSINQKGIIQKANLTAAKLLGIERNQLLQQTLNPFIFNDDRDIWYIHLRKINELECKQTCELKMIKEDGSLLHVQIDSIPIVDLQGNASLIRTVITDITDRKQAENELHRVEAEKQAIIDASVDSIIHIDNDMKVFWANEIAAARIKKAPEDLIGKKCYELFAGSNDFCSGCIFRDVLDTEKVGNTVLSLLGDNKADKSFWECYVVPVRDENNQVTGVIEIARNISLRKLDEEERERLIGKLQKALFEVKKLSGLLPICASCKKIRDDKGYWNQIESYIREHSDANFTHSICPECKKKLYPELSNIK